MGKESNKLSKSQKNVQPKNQQRISTFFAKRENTAPLQPKRGDSTAGGTPIKQSVPIIEVLDDNDGKAAVQFPCREVVALRRSPRRPKENRLTCIAERDRSVRQILAAVDSPSHMISPRRKRPATHGEAASPDGKRASLTEGSPAKKKVKEVAVSVTDSDPFRLRDVKAGTLKEVCGVPALVPALNRGQPKERNVMTCETLPGDLDTAAVLDRDTCSDVKSSLAAAVALASSAGETPRTPRKQDNTSDLLFDSVDDLDLSSPFKEESAAPVRPLQSADLSEPGWRRFDRYKVRCEEVRPDGSRVVSLSAAAADDDSRSERRVTLRGSWCHTQLRPGDVVHLLNTGPGDVIDNSAGQLVVSPDRLISGTAVVAATFCRRKAVLSELFRGLDPPNRVMLVGTLVHALFQKVVQQRLLTAAAVREAAVELLRRPATAVQVYGAALDMAELEKEVQQFVAPTLAWVRRYTEWGRRAEVLPAGGEAAKQQPDDWDGRVTEVRDIEESFWSPRLGVKGKIDLTVSVRQRGGSDAVLPLELKTGRSSFSAEHQGQVTLYSMMLAERRVAPADGLLVYLRTGTTRQVPSGLHRQRDLLQLRNEVTAYLTRPPAEDALTEPPDLPEGINSRRACQQCPHLVTCAAYRREEEPPHAIPAATEHISASHLDYFLRWSGLVRMESAAADGGAGCSAMSRLWTEPAVARQARGYCLASCRLRQVERAGETSWLHRLSRPAAAACQLNAGELVLVSSDAELALALGQLTSLTDTEACVMLERRLGGPDDGGDCSYHLDKYEYGGDTSAGTFLCNLARLMEGSERARRLREQVIDCVPPRFLSGLTRDVVVQCRAILRPLNKLQQRAMLRSLMAEDYLLIQGLPGTGKTSTVVALVRLLAARGSTVLLASYTHSAVDTILLKLSQTFTDFVRLGRTGRIHPALHPFCSENLTANLQSAQELDAFYASKPVVATTCLGINHPVLQRRRFDVCIVDEASQTVQPAALGPLLLADRFVLVGDPQQLPPVIKSVAARRAGMDQCMFARLAAEHNTVQLTQQYRMNRTLTAAANHLTYEGRLSCGSAQVEEATLPELERRPGDPVWLAAALDARLDRALVLLDTSDAGTVSSTSGGEVTNAAEAALVSRVVSALVERGVVAAEVGVIAPYRGQVRLLRRHLPAETEVSTVDQYQGRDKDVIVYTCTRTAARRALFSSEGGGDILSDQRRLTVAITRARRKLVMVGNRNMLLSYPPFCRLFSCLKSEDVVRVSASDVGSLPG